MNSIMSSRLTGEEYSVMKTKHNTVILGKLEIHEMSDLRVEDDKASFTLPVLDEGMTEKLFEMLRMCNFRYCVNQTKDSASLCKKSATEWISRFTRIERCIF